MMCLSSRDELLSGTGRRRRCSDDVPPSASLRSAAPTHPPGGTSSCAPAPAALDSCGCTVKVLVLGIGADGLGSKALLEREGAEVVVADDATAPLKRLPSDIEVVV